MAELKPVSAEDLLKMSFIGDLKSCKNRLVFIKADMDLKKKYVRDLMEYRIQDGSVRQLTSRGNIGSWLFKDENSIYFFENRKEEDTEKPQSVLMELPLDGGEALEQAVLDLDHASVQAVLENGTLVLTSSWKKQGERFEEDPDYQVIDESAWYFNGQGFVNGLRTGIDLYSPSDGSLKTRISNDYDVSQVSVFGNRIFFTGQKLETLRTDKEGLFEVDPESGNIREIIPEGKLRLDAIRACIDGIYIVGSECSRYGLNENPWIYLLNPESGKYDGVLGWGENVGNTVGTDCAPVGGNAVLLDEAALLFVSTIVDHCNLYSFDGSVLHERFEFNGSINSFALANGNALYFIGSDVDGLPQLYSADEKEAKCLTGFNSFLKDHYIARTYPVMYKNFENSDQMGWVLYPKDFDENKKYPGILDIHGGPKTVYGRVFYHEMQVWASEGYFVFFCNPFGADGQGNAYADLRGKYGTDDFTDLMKFTDAVLEAVPQIDPDRLSVTGGSYGGFMTNWIIGHTDRFKAAASQRSISNWTSFYGTSDIGPEFTVDQQAAGMDHPDRLWERSPISSADKVTTPTLFIHSDEDYRCPLEQGMQMVQALFQKKVPTRMCLFHGENHDLSRTGQPKHRLRRLNEITAWMKQYNPVNEN